MQTKKIKSYQLGSSLAEVMVAVGLMGGLSLAMMKLMENQNKAQKGIEAKADMNEINNEIFGYLNRYESCMATFKDQAPGQQIKKIFLKQSDFPNKPIITLGERYKSYPLKVTRLEIMTRTEEQNKKVEGVVVPNTSPGEGTATLLVEFTKTSKMQSIGAAVVQKTFFIQGRFYMSYYHRGCNHKQLVDACKADLSENSSKGGTSSELVGLCTPNSEEGDEYGSCFAGLGGCGDDQVLTDECRVYGSDFPLQECMTNDQLTK